MYQRDTWGVATETLRVTLSLEYLSHPKMLEIHFGKRSIIIYQRAPLKWHLRAWEGTEGCADSEGGGALLAIISIESESVRFLRKRELSGTWGPEKARGGCADSEGGGAILAPIHAPYCNLAALHDALAKRKMQKYNMQNDKYFLTWCIRLSVLSTSVHQGFKN